MLKQIERLRSIRRQKILAFAAGAPEVGSRCEGDDGRKYYLDEYQFWPEEMQVAEQAYFEQVDAEYEAAKAALLEA